MKKAIALIVAAGRGHRFGGPLAKQYLELNGAPVLRHSILAFQKHPGVSAVRVVIHPDDLGLYQKAVQGLGLHDPVTGGASRQDSVRLGLERLAPDVPEFVLIHDAARPFIGSDVIDRVLAGLETEICVIPALPLTDTIKRIRDGYVIATEDRSELCRVQTPQGFHFRSILKAHRQTAGQNFTDDAAICESVGLAVLQVAGDVANLKITTQEDMNVGDPPGTPFETRTGSGFDVHRFKSGNQVVLCGVQVPHSHALAGHSDADVGLHALTDALLGAIGEGDIGHFFPPSDDQWRGAPSDLFVRHAVDLIAVRGGRIINVDVTLICEAPKIGPHRLVMKDRVADILGICKSRVNVKATTTESLGFTGRGEGIAAQASVNVEIPVAE